MALFSAENIYIVTGASSGIGNAVAKKLIEEGATVVAIARRADKLEQLKNECVCPERCLIETADLCEHLEDMPSFLSVLKISVWKSFLLLRLWLSLLQQRNLQQRTLFLL